MGTDYQPAELLLAAGRLDEAEQKIRQILEKEPRSETARLLWKRLRKAQGRALTSDLSDEKKKEIYSSYNEVLGDRIFLTPDLLESAQDAKNIGEIAQSHHAIIERAVAEARKRTLEGYGLNEFELDLILNQGMREAWPAGTLDVQHFGVMRESLFRDSLRCYYCGKRNVAAFWPKNGDRVPFVYHEERTQEVPGTFRLRMDCPFCNHLWFIVWDQAPDLLAEQFVQHIERICKTLENDPARISVFWGMVSDDVLGKHLKFLRKIEAAALEKPEKIEHLFESEHYFNVLWMIPAFDPVTVKSFLPGGYLSHLESLVSKWDRSTKHFAHWIVCGDEGHTSVQLTFLPRSEEIGKLPSLFAVDLLTSEEKRRIGL